MGNRQPRIAESVHAHAREVSSTRTPKSLSSTGENEHSSFTRSFAPVCGNQSRPPIEALHQFRMALPEFWHQTNGPILVKYLYFPHRRFLRHGPVAICTDESWASDAMGRNRRMSIDRRMLGPKPSKAMVSWLEKPNARFASPIRMTARDMGEPHFWPRQERNEKRPFCHTTSSVDSATPSISAMKQLKCARESLTARIWRNENRNILPTRCSPGCLLRCSQGELKSPSDLEHRRPRRSRRNVGESIRRTVVLSGRDARNSARALSATAIQAWETSALHQRAEFWRRASVLREAERVSIPVIFPPLASSNVRLGALSSRYGR